MKKIWKILTIILIVIVVLIVFVIAADKIYGKIIKVEPGNIYLSKENSEEEIKAVRGSYSWREKTLISYINVNADASSPLTFDYTQTIKAKPGEKIYFKDDENWNSIVASVIFGKDRIEIVKVSIESNLEERYIVVPEMEKGKHVVQMDMKSEKGEAWYTFQLDIVE